MSDINIEQLVEEVKRMSKERCKITIPKNSHNCYKSILKFEQNEWKKEQARILMVKGVLIRQFLYPELAHAILSLETLNGLRDEYLKCVFNSYNKSEVDIFNSIAVGE